MSSNPFQTIRLACIVRACAVLTLATGAWDGRPAFAQNLALPESGEITIEDILTKDITEWMNIEVWTVAGVRQEWFTTPAAMYVVTAEDVRRTGHRTLADALRMVPGVFVGQGGSSNWIVGMRGFSSGLANKTLVLIDGRSVYDPLFNGTFWDVQDILLEDLDRIEVIRGPGPSLWGSNAMNGVINIITKHARETQGWYIGGGGGTLDRAFGEARYGGRISNNGWYRVWGKYFERDNFETITGASNNDQWSMAHGGARFDFDGDNKIAYTIQGDIYNADLNGLNAGLPVGHWARGGNVLFRILQDDQDNGWRLRTYFDRTDRLTASGLRVERNSVNADLRHWFRLGEHHHLMWGAGYHYTGDDVQNTATITYAPTSETLNTISAFIQDTITLEPSRWFLMIGSKFEYNNFTGFEVQPSGRLWWTPDADNTVWASISRVVRIPSRTELHATLGVPPNAVLPEPDLHSGELVAYEVGFRHRFNPRLTLDIAAYYNDYPRLIFVSPFPPFPSQWNNDGWGETYGTEITAIWRAADNLRLEASYSYVDVHIHGPVLQTTDEGGAPEHMVKFRSYLDITDNLEFNSALYYMDVRPTPGSPSYIRFDLGLTWRPTHNIELSAWGQNLLDPAHPETSATVEVPRSFYLKASLRF